MEPQNKLSDLISQPKATQKINNKNNNSLLLISLIFIAICGFGFGGFELWQRINNSQSKISTTLLSIDSDSNLGKKLYGQIQEITTSDACGQERHPLYELYEDRYVMDYDNLSNDVKFEIIAKIIPEVVNLKKDGEQTLVSGEKMEEILDSVFGEHEDIGYGVFGFTDLDSEGLMETQHVHLSDYDIEQANDGDYLISLERGSRLGCDAPRYDSRYEYIGLSNTIDDQLLDEKVEDMQMAMIVLEKKIIDRTTQDNEEKSGGYCGVLFGGKQDGENFFWIGTYYLGNTIEK